MKNSGGLETKPRKETKRQKVRQIQTEPERATEDIRAATGLCKSDSEFLDRRRAEEVSTALAKSST